MDFLHAAVAFIAAFLAGFLNSLAGGGTLITFPALIWLGLDSITANATSTVGLCAFAVGGALGYRKELRTVEPRMWWVGLPGLAGGLAGAVLLRLTPTTTFDRLVPFLILFATLLFMMQGRVQRALGTAREPAAASPAWFAAGMAFQFLIGVYGGYFGAGIGILMLAGLGILGMTDIYQMNGLRTVFGGALNLVASLYFIQQKMVSWPDAGVIAAASILGGFVGAGAARRIGRAAMRKVVVSVGFAMTLYLFLRV